MGEPFCEEAVENRTKLRWNASVVTLDIKPEDGTPISNEQEDRNIDVWGPSKDNIQRKQGKGEQLYGFQREEGESGRGLGDGKTLSDEGGGTLLSNMKQHQGHKYKRCFSMDVMELSSQDLLDCQEKF